MPFAAPSCILHTFARFRTRASTVTSPATVPSPASSTTATTTPIPPGPSEAPAATPPAESKPPAREPEREGYQVMPARTRRDTCVCTTLDGNSAIDMVYFRRWTMRLRCPCWLPVSPLMGPSVCTVPRKNSPDLPSSPVSDTTTPNTVSNVSMSPQANV